MRSKEYVKIGTRIKGNVAVNATLFSDEVHGIQKTKFRLELVDV
jgi:hypothetical protein